MSPDPMRTEPMRADPMSAHQLGFEVVGPEAATTVLAVVAAAFGDRPPLDPPTDALDETVERLAARLEHGCGVLASYDGEPVGAVLLDPVADGHSVYLRRFGIVPAARGRRIAHALVERAVRVAAERYPATDRAVVLARQELPRTLGFWEEQGFSRTTEHPPYVELARALPRRIPVPTADAMRGLGERLAEVLRAGDVVVLGGELGAGKTTFTQGLGRGLGVRGDVTSPTFVIARVHPSLTDGPALVHVDAYRLGGAPELDDLDLDTDLDRAVTVVEWGEGVAEALSDSPLEIQIIRSLAEQGPAATGADDDPLDPRTVEIEPLGPRWLGVALPVHG